VKLGPTGGSKLVGVLTATALIAALIVTGRAQSGAGRRLSSRADDSHAAAVARAASTPVGWLDSGWVRLVPTSNGLRRQCREAADFLGFAVPCPMLLPASLPGGVPRRFCDPEFLCVPGDGFLFEERRLVVPPGDVGVDGQGQGRLAIAAATRASSFPVACLGGRQVATINLHGTQGTLYECPPRAGAHFDGVLLRWREHGVVMAVSLHGRSEPNRRLVVALAAHMEVALPAWVSARPAVAAIGRRPAVRTPPVGSRCRGCC
jgi:hypothetical protein